MKLWKYSGTLLVPKERFPEEKDCTGNMNHG